MNKLPITTGYIEKHLTFLKLSLFKTKKTLLFVPTLKSISCYNLFCSSYSLLFMLHILDIHVQEGNL